MLTCHRQDETTAKSELLLIKSSEDQLLSEDAGSPVDTAYVTERDGLPILRAVFDVHYFHPDEVKCFTSQLYQLRY